MRVLLLRTWLTNIGNGFIDKGARQIIQQALPDSEIIEVSGYSNYAAENIDAGMSAGTTDVLEKINRLVKSKTQEQKMARERMVNVASFIDADIAVLPGCILYPGALKLYEPLLRKLTERGVKIIFLGAAGAHYSTETQKYVNEVLENIDAPVLITRDEYAYKIYSNNFEFSYNGIDCAFFINDWYCPPQSNRDFSVLTFDKIEEPNEIDTNQGTIIRTYHHPFGYSLPFHGTPRRMRDKFTSPDAYGKDNVFVSDTLEDYLFWYANTQTIHTDRVHACIPSLVYGNQAKFYYETPRKALFDNVPLSGSISEELVRLDEEKFKKVKEKQIIKFKEAISIVQE